MTLKQRCFAIVVALVLDLPVSLSPTEAGLQCGALWCDGCANCQAATSPPSSNDCQAGNEPQFQTVERTVMVPTTVTETRTINVTEYRTEERQCSYTVYRQVPETREIQIPFTVMVPETRTRTINYTVNRPVMETQTLQYTVMVPQTRIYTINCTVNKPVMETQTLQYTVMVPYQETRQAVRKVCRMVPVTVMKTMCEDQGHWEVVPVQNCQPSRGNDCVESSNRDRLIQTVGWRHYRSGCCGNGYGSAPGCNLGNNCGAADGCCAAGAANNCVQTQRRWVSSFVTKQVPCTVMQAQTEDIPYTYTVNLCKPETRTREVQVCRLVAEQQTREVACTVCVAETRTCEAQICRMVPEQHSCEVQYTACRAEQHIGMRQVTTCKAVPEVKTASYTVCVPYTVQKQVQVQVCKMMPKTIQCQVPVSNSCGQTGCACQ